ncbi:membrane protein insertase YidC [bacterium]|nr:membrane protein insertase YidC [bacterium]
MDRNTIIGILIVAAIVLVWRSPWYQDNVVGHVEPAADSTAVAQPPVPQARPAETESVSNEAPAPAAAGRAARPKKTTSVRDTVLVVSNNLFRAHLSSVGGGTLISWELIEKNPADSSEYRYKTSLEENAPVQLIPGSAEGNLGISTDRDLDLSFESYRLVENSVDEAGVRTIRFALDLGKKSRVEKTFVIRPDLYHMEMSVRFRAFGWEEINNQYFVEWQSGLQSTEPNIKDDLMYYKAMTLQGGERIDYKKGEKKGQSSGETEWIAIGTKYFLMAIIPGQPGSGAELFSDSDENWKPFHARLAMSKQTTETHHFKIFMGPMDYQVLKAYQTDLQKSMDFGWKLFKPFAIGALYVLQYLYGVLHNYGWAIIVFSIFIKIILYPLTRHSYQSMREMQAIQPKMNAIREKYKKDPQRMNEETIKLYKTHKINPMSGCLPMLLQMPVLIALFRLFRSTIMLRHAGFFLIRDLSAPDHILGSVNLLPIILGAAMLIQQRLSSTQNPQQKMMMYMMPLFLTFVFYKFSSGLNLYYLIFNIFTIIQEMIVKRGKGGEASEAAAAA